MSNLVFLIALHCGDSACNEIIRFMNYNIAKKKEIFFLTIYYARSEKKEISRPLLFRTIITPLTPLQNTSIATIPWLSKQWRVAFTIKPTDLNIDK